MKKTACLFLVMLLGASPSAFALELDYGVKAGHEVFNGAIAGSPNTDPPSTILLVTSLNLPLVHVEFNAGAHTSYLVYKNPERHFFIQDELVIAALARWSVPVIPALLTVDLGAGLDQRFSMDIRVLDRTFGINGETTSADISDQNGGPRTLMPISAQVSLDVAMTTLLLEARYNVELASGVLETGPSTDSGKEGGRTAENQTGDERRNDELWLLLGLTF